MAALSDSDKEFVLRVTRAVVEEVAPEELKSFPLLTAMYRKNPESFLLEESGASKGRIGIGHDVFIMVASVILSTVSQGVLQGVKDAIGEKVAEESKTLLMKMFERVRGPRHVEKKEPVLALPAQGQRLSQEDLLKRCHETLLKSGIEDPRAMQIAECIVKNWGIGPGNKEGQQ